jgi:hypothetical protein
MSDQVRHAVSYLHVLFMCRSCAGPYPIPDSEFGNPESGTPEPRAPSMERYRIFFPSPALFLLTTEHGAVW